MVSSSETSVSRSVFAGKKVCLLAPFPPRKGGVTVQTALLARALSDEGAEVLRVDTNLQKLRIPVIGTPIRLAVQPWVVLFRLLVALPKCDVLHIQAAANWGYMPAVLGVPLARLFGKRSVLMFQSGIGPAFMDRFPWLVKMPFRLATVPAVCSRELQQAFRDRGVETERLYNLFEPELFRYRARTEFSPRIIWTRSFDYLYDPLCAVRVFEIVKQRRPDTTMVMTSNGSLLADVCDYVRDRGIEGISMPGRISSEEVARLMNEANICLNTSRQDGLPTALLEAAAAGLPIVTTKAGGIASLFEHGVSAMLCEVGDAEALADGILRLLDDPDAAGRLGARARDVAMDYTWPQASKGLAAAYGLIE